jgi:hypothetical protein
MKKFTLSLTMIISAFIAYGQGAFKFNNHGGGFNVSVGTQAIDFEKWYGVDGLKMNTPQREWKFNNANDDTKRIDSIRWGSPGNSLIKLGFQGYGVVSDIILGGEFSVGIGGKKEQNNTYKTLDSIPETVDYKTYVRPYTAEVLFNVGLVAYRSKGFIAYPLLGIGYGATALRLQDDRPNRTYPEFTRALTEDDNIQNLIVWQRNIVADLGFGLQYLLGSSSSDKAKGFSIGVRAGYRIQPASSDLQLNSKSVPTNTIGDPSLPANGFYVKLLLGFGKIGER